MGTIIGLVNMLMNLRNFEQIGPAMAVAQLSTFYGLILAYGLWGPLAKRIDNYGRDMSVGGAAARARAGRHRRGALAARPAHLGGIGGGAAPAAQAA